MQRGRKGGRQRQAPLQSKGESAESCCRNAGGGDCWRDCPIFHSHNQSQLSVRGPIRGGGGEGRGRKRVGVLGFRRSLEKGRGK